jgi:hypothetical protein
MPSIGPPLTNSTSELAETGAGKPLPNDGPKQSRVYATACRVIATYNRREYRGRRPNHAGEKYAQSLHPIKVESGHNDR